MPFIHSIRVIPSIDLQGRAGGGPRVVARCPPSYHVFDISILSRGGRVAARGRSETQRVGHHPRGAPPPAGYRLRVGSASGEVSRGEKMLDPGLYITEYTSVYQD